ncbi:MAG: PKD domain-containing protein, partial [Cellulomonadaceae bacterium]|nr:PKD domain-containing protein [Cellulomonadaceae bacterium]
MLLAIAALTLGASLVPLQPASALDTSGAVIDDPACVENTLPANDDGSSSQVNLPFDINFYGTTYSTMWVNNNGNVTFDGPLSTYTPFGLLATNRAIIAPFFADVDTRGTGSQPVQYGYGATAYQGHAAVCVNWVNVGYFSGHADKLNSFQLLLVTRPDKGVGSFDIVFNYDQIQWETGDYSGGMNGYGGTSARVGFSSGAGTVGTATELPGSGVSRAFLDQNAGGDTDGAGLKWSKLSSDVLGRYVFSVRAGGVIGDTYVAIGDSYQSGEGAHDYLAGTDTDTNKCHRSANAYPELLVDRGVVRLDLDFVACSGAVMIDLLRDEDPEGDGVPYDEDAQINHLGADTRLVTIGIVGNDLKFSDTVKECVIRSLGKWVTSPVFSRSCSGEMDEEVTERIDDLQGGYVGDYLMSIYRLVRTKAPYARVVVVSYPRFFPVDGSGGIGGCATLRKSDQRWMNSKIVRADKEIGQIARAAGFEYVNMADVLDGHEQCTEEPGMNGILPQAQSSVAKPESFHPNALGHGLMADRIKEQLYAGPAPSFTIHRGETVTRTFLVRGGGLAVNVGWPGSDVVTTLTSPSGVVYTRSEPQGADHGNGPTYEYFQVDNPEQGEWTVSMYGVDVDPAGEPVTFDAYDVPIANEAPTAALSVTGSGRTFQFDAGGSTDSDGAITDFMWDFGDGATATGAHVEHTYAYDGSFAPVLEVVDDDGDSSFAQAATNIARK